MKDYRSPRDARRSLTAYLGSYKCRRLHQALGYQIPTPHYYRLAAHATDVLAVLVKKGRGM